LFISFSWWFKPITSIELRHFQPAGEPDSKGRLFFNIEKLLNDVPLSNFIGKRSQGTAPAALAGT